MSDILEGVDNGLTTKIRALDAAVKEALDLPMMKKADALQAIIQQQTDILKDMGFYTSMLVESYNGMTAFIDQACNNPSEMTVINEKLKAVRAGIWRE